MAANVVLREPGTKSLILLGKIAETNGLTVAETQRIGDFVAEYGTNLGTIRRLLVRYQMSVDDIGEIFDTQHSIAEATGFEIPLKLLRRYGLVFNCSISYDELEPLMSRIIEQFPYTYPSTIMNLLVQYRERYPDMLPESILDLISTLTTMSGEFIKEDD